MVLPLEFGIDGPPVSQQARRRSRVREWTQQVREVAEHHWIGSSPVSVALTVSITYVFDAVDLDIDNISKPILDAMKGLVYVDDSQIMDLICRKRHHLRAYRVENPSELFDSYLQNSTEFIVVRVGPAYEPGVTHE